MLYSYFLSLYNTFLKVKTLLSLFCPNFLRAYSNSQLLGFSQNCIRVRRGTMHLRFWAQFLICLRQSHCSCMSVCVFMSIF